MPVIGGLDASNVNGSIDLAALKLQYGLSFVLVKATEGTGFRDPLFPELWAAAKELGLARAAYHFGHPGEDPGAQAGSFLGYVRSCGLEDDDMLSLDHEVSDGKAPAVVSAFGRTFCGLVHSLADRLPLAYTFVDFALTGNCTGLGGYPLWIASWNGTPGRPVVPAPWKTWVIHQYTSQGIDLDVANYPDAVAMTRALGVPRKPPAPPKPPEDMVNVSPLQLPAWQSGPDGKTPAVTVDLGSAGTYKAIGFSSDWPLAGQPQPAIRVAVHSVKHDWSQIVEHQPIPEKGKWVLVFSAPDVDYLSVSRANASPALVSAGT